ncbi:putative DNA (cytosine-5)-methyltransferase [Cocos nucifera]|uniref:Putative DNA (Cytosine-5)-methyltransferase n=1 Tax=Cocos nucifera TaxID=13894 RepID=A0A8K0HX63_COCNU|nr:putative DNA (cytosine-5)-methyltransferase [Cocos nucifera]
MKRGRGRPPAKKSIDFQMEENSDTKRKQEGNEEWHEEPRPSEKQPKRAAAWSSIKEASKTSIIAPKKEKPKLRELAALAVTRIGADDVPPSRKLLDFMFHGADGNPLPIEASEVTEVFISSIIMPSDGLVNETDRGFRCDKFAKIQSWAISGYDEDIPVIWISTLGAKYRCLSPHRTYKKFFDHLLEKAWVCLKVQKTLRVSKEGILNMSLNELIARVICSLRGNACFAKRPADRDFVISLGEFIFEQLIKLDKESGNERVKLETVPALISLQEECKSQTECIKTDEGKDIKLAEDSNEKLARLMQDEEDRRNMRQQRTRQPAMIRNKFYFETDLPEIAAEYPSPGYYKARDNEMDEEFYNSETDDADELPRRILQSWALYDSYLRFVSIEKLPMKTWMDSDSPIFGSGCMIKDDGSCCCTNIDPGQDNVLPVFLSEVKEWAIEFSSMTILISIRTDAAWYRLGKPAKEYAPWYEPVLRVARLVERVIRLIKKQRRASRLTFSDATKQVTELEKDNPAYISSSIKSVEQYMVVHGQMILKLFDEYPEKMISQCPFVSGLRRKMEEKRQAKQTTRGKLKVHKEASKKQNAGMVPPESRREKLMQATTTTRLINRIWKDYYNRYFPEEPNEEDDYGLIEEEIEEKEILAEEDKASRRCSLTASTSNFRPRNWNLQLARTEKPKGKIFKSGLVRPVLFTGKQVIK